MYKSGEIIYASPGTGHVNGFIVLYQEGDVVTGVSTDGMMNSVFPVKICLNSWIIAACRQFDREIISNVLESFQTLLRNIENPINKVTMFEETLAQLQQTSQSLSELLKPYPELFPYSETIGVDVGNKITISGKDREGVHRLSEIIRNTVE
jgi:hypothetical protein